MSRTIHALLVAIDGPPGSVPALQGCANDIDAFASYLSERVDTGGGITLNASFREGQWSINGGATHGIPSLAGTDAARLAVFPFDAGADVLADPARAVATARVEEVFPSCSRLPGSSLQGASVSWLLAGWTRSADFELALDGCSEFGLSRFSAYRGLDELALARLVSVGRTPRSALSVR
jgi:hypothetical protein